MLNLPSLSETEQRLLHNLLLTRVQELAHSVRSRENELIADFAKRGISRSSIAISGFVGLGNMHIAERERLKIRTVDEVLSIAHRQWTQQLADELYTHMSESATHSATLLRSEIRERLARIGMPDKTENKSNPAHDMWLHSLLSDLRREVNILVDRAEIASNLASEPQKQDEDVIEVKPGLWGISVNFNAIYKKIVTWRRRIRGGQP